MLCKPCPAYKPYKRHMPYINNECFINLVSIIRLLNLIRFIGHGSNCIIHLRHGWRNINHADIRKPHAARGASTLA